MREHVPKYGRHEHQCSFAFRETSDDVGSPPDLPVQPLEGVVGPYLSPVGGEEAVVAQCLSDSLFKRFGGSLQLHILEAGHDARRLLESAFTGLLREDRPEHSTDFFRFVGRNVLQHVPFEVDDAPLPGCSGKEVPDETDQSRGKRPERRGSLPCSLLWPRGGKRPEPRRPNSS